MTDISEEKLEEMEVDQPLLKASVEKLKHRLNIKIRELETLESKMRVGRKMIAEMKQKRKEERMSALRLQRATLLRQQSDELAAAARPAPQKDLTEEGIEPNPSVQQPAARMLVRRVTVPILTLLFFCFLLSSFFSSFIL